LRWTLAVSEMQFSTHVGLDSNKMRKQGCEAIEDDVWSVGTLVQSDVPWMRDIVFPSINPRIIFGTRGPSWRESLSQLAKTRQWKHISQND
jgi:hypothetical protein